MVVRTHSGLSLQYRMRPMRYPEAIGKEVKLLVRPDCRDQNMEAKIDNLAEELSNLTIALKKCQLACQKNHVADHKGRRACTTNLVLIVTNPGMAQSNVRTAQTVITGRQRWKIGAWAENVLVKA